MSKQISVSSKFVMIWFLLLCLIHAESSFSQTTNGDPLALKAKNRLKKWENPFTRRSNPEKITLDSVAVTKNELQIGLYFSKGLSYLPVREVEADAFEQSLRKSLRRKFRKYSLRIMTDNHLFHELIPNAFRKNLPLDKKRGRVPDNARIPVVRRLDKTIPALGLYNANIALWHSHGCHYEQKLDRWEWQRARLFGSVEDLLTATYVLPYLVPMLENAGASVFLPQERDIQTNEVIVDNDKSTGNSELIVSPGLTLDTVNTGFLVKDTLFPAENPFKSGTSLVFDASVNGGKTVTYVPDIPEKGTYAVTISYLRNPGNCSAVSYSVNHSGGKTDMLVNQKIGGGTWIYLGSFYFNAGKNRETGSVVIRVPENQVGSISADAVRFGGGMGNVARRPSDELVPNVKSVNSIQTGTVTGEKINSGLFGWKTSGKPRFMEGARYFLQYCGMPDSTVYNLNGGKNDYNDDYQSRGAWVNYLAGGTENLNPDIKTRGLGIPIDLSFALHTDAGITTNDSVIGTLGIYNTLTDKGVFPNGQSKMVSRDFADIVQTQVTDDIRALYYPIWNRRALWDKKYSEAVKPNVPALLLELLSHQNLSDMKLSLDPQFRFSACRSIYKGMLKFLAFQEERAFVVQPLPVADFSITPMGGKSIKLSWKPVQDPLESTARPLKYKLYKRVGNEGFDNGMELTDTSVVVELEKYNSIYSFNVTAINDGGESFPSEILSAGFIEKKPVVLVVNAFDRVSGPSVFDSSQMGGIAWWDDQGVADHFDIGYCGTQYDYNRKSEWLDDDSPGWGASHADMEGKMIPGNSFDFPCIHGESIMKCGYSFVSESKKAFCNPALNTSNYQAIDVILGEEKSTPLHNDTSKYIFTIYTPEFRDKLKSIADQGGNIFMSGAYVGTDLIVSHDLQAAKFTENVLHFTWRTGHAVKEGNVYSTDIASHWFRGGCNFNTGYRRDSYTVESPDAIEPSGKGAISAFRYTENNTSAGVIYQGNYKSVVLGFPFETIIDQPQRDNLMNQVLNYLKK